MFGEREKKLCETLKTFIDLFIHIEVCFMTYWNYVLFSAQIHWVEIIIITQIISMTLNSNNLSSVFQYVCEHFVSQNWWES